MDRVKDRIQQAREPARAGFAEGTLERIEIAVPGGNQHRDRRRIFGHVQRMLVETEQKIRARDGATPQLRWIAGVDADVKAVLPKHPHRVLEMRKTDARLAAEIDDIGSLLRATPEHARAAPRNRGPARLRSRQKCARRDATDRAACRHGRDSPADRPIRPDLARTLRRKPRRGERGRARLCRGTRRGSPPRDAADDGG